MRKKPTLWDYLNRAMVVVGTIATVGSFSVAAYSLAFPGTVSNLLQAILDRMEQEASIPDRDRFGLAYFTCTTDSKCMMGIGKYNTSSAAQIGVQLCSPDGIWQGERKSYGMMRAESNINTIFEYPHLKYRAVEVRLIVEHGNDVFTIVAPLRAENDDAYSTYSPPTPPSILSGDHGCLS